MYLLITSSEVTTLQKDVNFSQKNGKCNEVLSFSKVTR